MKCFFEGCGGRGLNSPLSLPQLASCLLDFKRRYNTCVVFQSNIGMRKRYQVFFINQSRERMCLLHSRQNDCFQLPQPSNSTMLNSAYIHWAIQGLLSTSSTFKFHNAKFRLHPLGYSGIACKFHHLQTPLTSIGLLRIA
jgi:hypothetical protein